MKTPRIKTFLIAVFTAGLVFAAVAETPRIVTEVRQKYGKDITLKTSFDLEILWKIREKQEKKQGTLCMAPGDKFRLELDRTTWVSDGRTYWQYSQATNQVVIKQLLDVDLSMHPTQILSTYLYEYEYSLTEEDEKQAVLKWTAPGADRKALAQTIMIWVDKKKMLLRKLWVVDTNGNESTYIFKKTQVGGDIPSGEFKLDIPEGASVLDTRE